MSNSNFQSPTFKGFSTVGVNQPGYVQQSNPGRFGGSGSLTVPLPQSTKFMLTDQQLVLRDLLNALSIQQGQKVGNPAYGTTLWSYVFEPQGSTTQQLMQTEIRRVIALDPRITLNTLQVFTQSDGVLIQIEISFQPYNQVASANFFLNRYDGSIQQLAQ